MEELRTLVVDSQRGDLEAFGEVVERFQGMAFAVAYMRLGDYHLAQDASQEAFVEAYLNLGQLQQPMAFPGWIRTIVTRQCMRMVRRKNVPTLTLEAAAENASPTPGPEELVETAETKELVWHAINAFPEQDRLPTIMFHIMGHSQAEIANLLEVPLTTVKKRLQYARRRLKDRIEAMSNEFSDLHPPPGPSADQDRAATHCRQDGGFGQSEEPGGKGYWLGQGQGG